MKSLAFLPSLIKLLLFNHKQLKEGRPCLETFELTIQLLHKTRIQKLMKKTLIHYCWEILKDKASNIELIRDIQLRLFQLFIQAKFCLWWNSTYTWLYYSLSQFTLLTKISSFQQKQELFSQCAHAAEQKLSPLNNLIQNYHKQFIKRRKPTQNKANISYQCQIKFAMDGQQKKDGEKLVKNKVIQDIWKQYRNKVIGKRKNDHEFFLQSYYNYFAQKILSKKILMLNYDTPMNYKPLGQILNKLADHLEEVEGIFAPTQFDPDFVFISASDLQFLTKAKLSRLKMLDLSKVQFCTTQRVYTEKEQKRQDVTMFQTISRCIIENILPKVEAISFPRYFLRYFPPTNFTKKVFGHLKELKITNIQRIEKGLFKFFIVEGETIISKLVNLTVNYAELNDQDMMDLVVLDMPRLSYLNLSNNEVSNVGFKFLVRGRWPKLSSLIINENLVNQFGIKELRNSQWPRLSFIRVCYKGAKGADYCSKKVLDMLVPHLPPSTLILNPNSVLSKIEMQELGQYHLVYRGQSELPLYCAEKVHFHSSYEYVQKGQIKRPPAPTSEKNRFMKKSSRDTSNYLAQCNAYRSFEGRKENQEEQKLNQQQ